MGRYRGRLCLPVCARRRAGRARDDRSRCLELRFTDLGPMLPDLERRWSDTVQAPTRAAEPAGLAGPVLTGRLAQRWPSRPWARSSSTGGQPPSAPARSRDALRGASCRRLHRLPRRARGDDERHRRGCRDRSRAAGSVPAPPGLTPAAYLSRVRLDRAHRELVDSDPAGRDTVPAVAARWGSCPRARSSPPPAGLRMPTRPDPARLRGGMVVQPPSQDLGTGREAQLAGPPDGFRHGPRTAPRRCAGRPLRAARAVAVSPPPRFSAAHTQPLPPGRRGLPLSARTAASVLDGAPA